MNEHNSSLDKTGKKKGLFNKLMDRISGLPQEEQAESIASVDTIIGSPLKGQVLPLSAVKDEAFSSEAFAGVHETDKRIVDYNEQLLLVAI